MSDLYLIKLTKKQMSKTSAILGLIALIAIGGFIIFGEEKNTETQLETEQEILVEKTENPNIDTGKDSGIEEPERREILVTYTSSGFSPSIINIEMENLNIEKEKLVQEIQLGTLLSLMYWVLWSGSICKNPNIKFDYLLHGIERMETYLKLKEHFFKS